MIRVLHVLPPRILEGELFQGIRRYHDRSQFQLYFATTGASERVEATVDNSAVESSGLGLRNRAWLPAAVARLARIIKRHDIDIVHTHLLWPGIVGLLAARLASKPRVVQTRHYSDMLQKMGMPIRSRFYGRIACLMDLTLANSEFTRRVMVEDEGVPENRIETVPLGLRYDVMTRPATDAADADRLRWGTGSRLVIGGIGRLVEIKGYQFAIEALARVRATVPTARLLLAGSGPYESHLRRQAERLGVGSSVDFLGQIPTADLARFYESIDVFVHPSLTEGFGLVLLEAMGMEKPIVAFDIGPTREIVDSGTTGLLVPAADVRQLADAIVNLGRDPVLRKCLGRAARESAEARFGMETMVRRYERAYLRVVKANSKGQSPTPA